MMATGGVTLLLSMSAATTASAYQLGNRRQGGKGNRKKHPHDRERSPPSLPMVVDHHRRPFSSSFSSLFASSKKQLPQQIGIATSNHGESSNAKRAYRVDVEGDEDVPLRADGPSSKTSSSSFGIIESILKENRRLLVPKTVVRTVEDLRSAILDDQLSLSDTKIVQPILSEPTTGSGSAALTSSTETSTDLFKDHAVRNLIQERYRSCSTPGNRQDGSKLALAIEGGGMRGCVSAGMAAAITALGLTDTIDVMYGSSAGSVVGAYLVSRQVCMDVYVDILPAAKDKFVCKKRMVKSLASSVGQILIGGMRKSSALRRQLKHNPGMNISFVLDGIMGTDHGIRPLDLQNFVDNDVRQPLRVVSSAIDPQSGRLFSKCFGSEDFFNETAVEKWTTAGGGESSSQQHHRRGLFACLEASMTVPGATGPPVNIKSPGSTDILPCFDAFCFEPIPYRSAVEEGATHVLVLCSRPEDYVLKTKPGIYETGVAPLYFHSHGHSSVAEYFEQGGQQYVYAEDILTLEAAAKKKVGGCTGQRANEDQHRVLVAPSRILYGVKSDDVTLQSIQNRESEWKRAHLMPIRVPKGQKELPTLEQDKDAVLAAVRGGFSAAFDSLSSIVGMEHIEGSKVARLVFPDEDDDLSDYFLGTAAFEKTILETKLHVPGEPIPERGVFVRTKPFGSSDTAFLGGTNSTGNFKGSPYHYGMGFQNDLSRTLMMTLPGFQEGRYSHLAKGLLGSATSRRSS